MLDAREFYARYPKWSLMGKMVSDTRGAIDSLTQMEMIDAQRIYLMGYSLGAKVGLVTAALDARVQGLAAVSGFDPLRLATPDRGVEGIATILICTDLFPVSDSLWAPNPDCLSISMPPSRSRRRVLCF